MGLQHHPAVNPFSLLLFNELHESSCNNEATLAIRATFYQNCSNPNTYGKAKKLIRKSILVLALGTFALGIAQFSMMGILSSVAHDLKTGIPEAGDFISAYSIGIAIGAPALIIMSRYPLKRVLLFLCALIAIGNMFAALSAGYHSFLTARLISGLPHGAYFGVAAIVAERLASQGQKATAVAIMISGMTVANVAGVPLVVWLTHIASWRITFFMAAGAAILAFLSIWMMMPDVTVTEGKVSLKSQFRFLRQPAPWLIMIGAFCGQAAILSWYSYMEPILVGVTHIAGKYVSFIMALAGIGMFLGGLVAGKLADRHSPGLVTGAICILMLPILCLAYFFSQYKIIYLCVVFFGAAEIFALLGPVQYLMVRFAPGGEMAGGACIQIALNISGALAAFLGGCAINSGLGLTSPALIGMPFAFIAAIAMFHFSRSH